MTLKIRAQYHVRKTTNGFDAWDVRRLIKLTKNFPVIRIDPASLPGIESNHWYQEEGAIPSPRSIVEHIRLIEECDLRYPIILDASGRVMDGMHRVCKALLHGIKEIEAVQFESDPTPDHEDCDPAELSYE